MRILIIDNYDSFTYNLFHYVEQFAADVDVCRNDEITLKDCGKYSHIIISPGPGLPKDAGITMQVIEKFHLTKPILGVCLGCQALAEFYGGSLYNQNLVAHGIRRKVTRCFDASWLLKGLPNSFMVGLYHSWAVEEQSLPNEWNVTARSERDVLMVMEHTKLPLAGVQFHPESIMSEYGLEVIGNWLNR